MSPRDVTPDPNELQLLAKRLLELLAQPSAEPVPEAPSPNKSTKPSDKDIVPYTDKVIEKKMQQTHDVGCNKLDERVFRYPIILFEKPMLVQHPFQDRKAMNTAINIRISFSLDLSLQEHLKSFQGVTQSEWIRDAVLAKLSAEQLEIARLSHLVEEPAKGQKTVPNPQR